MASSETVVAVDLFCGGGGLSTALAEACEDLDRDVELVAVNHDTTAIETHKRNHPWATHYNAKVEELHPPEIVEPGTVDILIAAPECTHFSSARGGVPVNEQARASPMHVLDWVGKTRPQTMLLENVPEFESWGPIVDGEATRDGSKFEAWKAQLEADRYSVTHGVLNAADYGDATSRRRFFVMARRDYRPDLPEPTHDEHGDGDRDPWRSAADIIDFSERGDSVWTRSRPLSNNTMRRIAQGIRQHCDDRLEAYADVIADLTPDDVREMQENIVPASEMGTAASDRDAPFIVEATVTAEDATPMVMGQHSNARAKDATESPVPTIATRGAIHCINVSPFVKPRNLPQRGIHSNGTFEPEDKPLHTVTAKNHDGHLVSPFLVEYYGNSDTKPVDGPLPTVTTKDRHALCTPDLYPWGLGIQYRMLQPRELAAAQGFPDDYDFAGNKTETTKQIGNAVPVNLGQSLVKHLLQPTQQPTMSQYEPTEAVANGGVSTDD